MSATTSTGTYVPEVFRRKVFDTTVRYPTLKYAAGIPIDQIRDLLPELTARAYIHMQELSWPLGRDGELFLGTERKRAHWWSRSYWVPVGVRTHAILLGSYIAFTAQCHIYKSESSGGDFEPVPYVRIDPADPTLSERTAKDLFDNLCFVLNYVDSA